MGERGTGAKETWAFREAEKKYQLHKTQDLRYSRGKLRGKKWVVRETDLSDVCDLDDAADVWKVAFNGETSIAGYSFNKHPGFYVFPGAVCVDDQLNLIRSALEEYPEPPASTNLTPQFGKLPGIWKAAAKNLTLNQTSENTGSLASAPNTNAASDVWVHNGNGMRAVQILRKLRWAALGPHYNWTKRVYEFDTAYRRLPNRLRELACKFASIVHGNGVEFSPDAALVNYYHEGHTLGGHKDDVEGDLSLPIVSVSLGCPAIFLIGGQERDEAPTAVLLRSGDVVVLSGHARTCYHGVPRVFTDWGLPDDLHSAGEFASHLEHLKNTRINISIRQVALNSE